MKKRAGLLRDKRAEDIIFPVIIFIILNLIFFGSLWYFIYQSSIGVLVYEQVYAKQIALLIDNAKPEMTMLINFDKGLEIAGENKQEKENIVMVNSEERSVIVKLSGKGGYKMNYFSGYDVSTRWNDNSFEIKVGEGEWYPEKSGLKGKTISRDYSQILSVMEYAKENAVSERMCNCGDKCRDYANYIIDASKKYGEDPILLLSIMMQESKCENNAGSSSSWGLMQINLMHCGEYGLILDKEKCKNQLVSDTELNIETGARILREKYNLDKNGKKFSGACTPEYREKTYYGMDAAVRGYNGWGCGKDKNGKPIVSQDYYVDEVAQRVKELNNIDIQLKELEKGE